MKEIFSNTGNLMFLLIFSVPIIAIIGYYWHAIVKTRSNNELKQSMLDRGMSAQEIEQVMNAGNSPDKEKTEK